MKAKIYMCAIAALFALHAHAQTGSGERMLCDFERADSYSSVGVWDTWADSPFVLGKLKGNVSVVGNHLSAADPVRGLAPNPSRHILALQRSRHGSNTFGALVALRAPFAQTKKTQYVHVKIYSPKAGPAMLIGFGRRDDRPHQSAMTEQFWATSSKPLVAGKWNDAVFAVSGADGVTISNLLIVPDATSPHNLEADFATYIDDIVLSDDKEPFFTLGNGGVAVSSVRRAKGTQVALTRGVDDLGGGLNGDILLADGSALTGKKAVVGQPLRIRVKPAPGFKFDKVVIRHGNNVESNASGEWTETTVKASQFDGDGYTVPASVVDGDMRFVPYFVNVSK